MVLRGALQLFGAGEVFDGGGDLEIEVDANIAEGLEASGFLDGVFSVLGIEPEPGN